MPKNLLRSLVAVLFAVLVFGSSVSAQNCEGLTRAQLKEMVVQLGYEVKDIVTEPGKEKFSVTLNRNALDIPIGFELSPSGKYIWLTVNLGDPPLEGSAINKTLLIQNSKIQPCQFYITESGRLMMGLPLNNSGITNAFLRDRIEAIAGNVGSTKQFWQR